jgi:hypothetical protein
MGSANWIRISRVSISLVLLFVFASERHRKSHLALKSPALCSPTPDLLNSLKLQSTPLASKLVYSTYVYADETSGAIGKPQHKPSLIYNPESQRK